MSETPRTGDEEESQRTQRLEAQLGALTARVFELERVAALRGEAQSPPILTGRGASPPPVRDGSPAEAILPPPGLDTAGRMRGQRSLESRVGSQWLNRIGIVAVLIGVAWFLEFAFESHWIGALGRVLIGLGAGVALIAWSERFRSKGFAGFSYSLKALGSGVLYLSLWAAVSVYHLVSPGVGFAGMIAVTTWNAFVAWMQDAELLAVYALAGAFATPLLLSTGQNEEVFLFSYLVLMNAAMVTLLVVKGWSRLLVVAFLGTVALYWGWYWNYYAAAALTTTTVFLLLFFLLFAAATVLGRQRANSTDTDGSGTDSSRMLLSMGNAAFVFAGLYTMLNGPARSNDAVLAGWAVGFAAFYLALWRLMRRDSPVRLPLADTHLAIAMVFVTLAIPLAVHGHWVTVGWLVEGAALVWLAMRTPTLLMQALGAGGLLLGLLSLAADATVGQTQVIWNPRLLSFAVAVAVMGLCARLLRRPASPAAQQHLWAAAAVVAEVTAVLLLVIAVVLEIHTWWWSQPLSAAAGARPYQVAVQERDMAAQFTYSAWFLLASVVALTVGFRRRSALLRWEGLVLLAVTILKVFLLDTSELTQGYRIVSFLLLGVLLLAVSFAYQKDWLKLRAD